jgi:hypothetical protein
LHHVVVEVAVVGLEVVVGGASAAVLPEEGASAVTAFDGPVEVVPLVDPARGGLGGLRYVEGVEGFAEGDLAEEGEGAVERTAREAAGMRRCEIFARALPDGRGSEPTRVLTASYGAATVREPVLVAIFHAF